MKLTTFGSDAGVMKNGLGEVSGENAISGGELSAIAVDGTAEARLDGRNLFIRGFIVVDNLIRSKVVGSVIQKLAVREIQFCFVKNRRTSEGVAAGKSKVQEVDGEKTGILFRIENSDQAKGATSRTPGDGAARFQRGGINGYFSIHLDPVV